MYIFKAVQHGEIHIDVITFKLVELLIPPLITHDLFHNMIGDKIYLLSN